MKDRIPVRNGYFSKSPQGGYLFWFNCIMISPDTGKPIQSFPMEQSGADLPKGKSKKIRWTIADKINMGALKKIGKEMQKIYTDTIKQNKIKCKFFKRKTKESRQDH